VKKNCFFIGREAIMIDFFIVFSVTQRGFLKEKTRQDMPIRPLLLKIMIAAMINSAEV
jgi:hypothetical protein